MSGSSTAERMSALTGPGGHDEGGSAVALARSARRRRRRQPHSARLAAAGGRSFHASVKVIRDGTRLTRNGRREPWYLGVPSGGPGGDLAQGGGLALVGGGRGEQRSLGLGAGPGAERPGRADMLRQVAGAQPGQRVVVPLG